MSNESTVKWHPKPLEELTLLDRFLFDTAVSDPDIEGQSGSGGQIYETVGRTCLCPPGWA